MKEFISYIYDLFRLYSDEFYDDLLNYNFAPVALIAAIGIAGTFLVLYYFVFDRPKWGTIQYWLSVLFGVGLLAAIAGYVIANNAIVNAYMAVNQATPAYENDYIYFAGMNALFGVLIFFIFSVLFKRLLSTHSPHIPF